MTEELDRIEELAKAATEGPWSMVASGAPQHRNQCWYVEPNPPGEDRPFVAEMWSETDAAFIAAANPAAILRMTALIRKLQAELDARQ